MKLSNTEIVEEYILGDDKVMDMFEKNSRGNQNTEDLFNDLIVYILEYDNDKLNKIINSGDNDFRYWFTRIVTTQIRSPRSGYHYKYRKPRIDTKNIEDDYRDYFYHEQDYYETIDTDLLDPTPLSERVSRLYEEIRMELSWYERELYQLWLDCNAEKGSYQKMHDLTGIPVSSIGSTMRETKEFLKNRIEHELKEELNYEFRMDDIRSILEGGSDSNSDNTTN